LSLSSSSAVDLPPHAESLIEGLRDFGYSIETSLADIIDNSVTAKAQRIDIVADTVSDDPWIAIVDDGKGMSRDELLEALRPGSRNPRSERHVEDLGRFGLGLKSASFSQCRQLTVVSRKMGATTAVVWDLDKVAETKSWTAYILEDPAIVPGFQYLGDAGTVVAWKKLDRLDGGYSNNDAQRTRILNESLSGAERHLRLVFHRYIGGKTPKLSLFLNNSKLEAIDPFAEGHPARQVDSEEFLKLSKGVVKLKCVTLPHHKKMSQDDWDDIGGPEGHLKSQGLYVYRADRLIIAGGWLGLARQSESTKLCRIAVDIPNTMDAEWKIDVKKASAQLPPVVRKKLKNLVERFVSTSKRTYSRRGRKLISEDQLPVWSRILQDDKIVFKPDISHPVFAGFRNRLDNDLKNEFDACIRLIGSSLPVETIYSDIIGGAEKLASDHLDDEALNLQVGTMVENLIQGGISPESIPDILKNVVILRTNWDRTEKIMNKYLSGVA